MLWKSVVSRTNLVPGFHRMDKAEACCITLQLTLEFPLSPTCSFPGFGPETGGQWERERARQPSIEKQAIRYSHAFSEHKQAYSVYCTCAHKPAAPYATSDISLDEPVSADVTLDCMHAESIHTSVTCT